MESKMDQKLDMFLDKVAERFGMNNQRPSVAAAADESDGNGRAHRKLHRKEVAVSIFIAIIIITGIVIFLPENFAICPLQKEIDYLLRQNGLEHELNTDLTFREQETEVDAHVVPVLQEALGRSGIQATHTLIHDVLHQKFKYQKSKKILSAEEKENLQRRQHANNRSQEVRCKFVDYW